MTDFEAHDAHLPDPELKAAYRPLVPKGQADPFSYQDIPGARPRWKPDRQKTSPRAYAAGRIGRGSSTSLTIFAARCSDDAPASGQ